VETAVVVAPAKINTRLEVLGKRADGYHELDTFLVAIDLADEIRVDLADHGDVRLSLEGPQVSSDIPCDDRNLAVRAARAVLQVARVLGKAGPRTGLDLVLTKRIPSQSGLGGASSDAAGAWLGAAHLLEVAFSVAERDELLAALGSDTVFFAAAGATGAARCTGRGGHVEQRPAPSGWSIALVTPRVVCPTAQVYGAFTSLLRGARAVSTVPRTDGFSIPAHAARSLLANDLEPAALAAVPGLHAWRESLDALGMQHFCLSGSGSSFFGLYPDDAAAAIDLERIEALARARRLDVRFAGVVHPAGHGVRLRPYV